MSNTPSFPPTNPYAPSSYAEFAPAGPAHAKMPGFCLAMFVVSLIFCVLRIPVVALGAIGWMQIAAGRVEPSPVLASVPFEVLSGAAIVLFGLIGNTAMLLKQRWGIVVGYLTVFSSVCSMGVAVWQLSYLFQDTAGLPQQAGVVSGGAFTLLIRIAIVGLYAAAIMTFSKWLASRPAAAY